MLASAFLFYYILAIDAGWSSLAARRAHNPKVAGSNPAPATKKIQSVSSHRKTAEIIVQETNDLSKLVMQSVQAVGLAIWSTQITHLEGVVRVIVLLHGQRPVTIDDCVMADKQIRHQLAIATIRPEQLQLEVSSPGLNRPLTEAWHFQWAKGQCIQLKLKKALAGVRSFSGQIIDVVRESLQLDLTDGGQQSFQLGDIRQARLDSIGNKL